MFDRFSIARKAYRVLVSAKKIVTSLADIGFVMDCDCCVNTIEDNAFHLLIELFPEVDESFFVLFFFETTEVATEEEFLRVLKEELASAIEVESEDRDRNEEKDNQRATAHVVTIKYSPSPEEIDRALRKLFGM